MDYTEVYYWVDEDEGYYQPSAVSTIDVSRFNLPEDFEESFDNRYKLSRGNYDTETYQWSELYEYFKDMCDVGLYQMEVTPQEIKITWDDEEVRYDPERFDNFCRDMERFDDKIENMLDDEDELLKTLMDAGFIGEPPADPEFSMISEYIDSEEEWFDNFTIEGRYINRPFTVSAPTQIILNPPEADYVPFTDVGNILYKSIINLGKENFKPTTKEDDVAQLQFQKFFESYVDTMEGIRISSASGKAFYNSNRQFVAIDVKIRFPKMDNKNFEFVQFLDSMWKHVINCLRLASLEVMEKYDLETFEISSKKHNYPQLQRVYSKYIL
jgi:hypothetical protein